MTLWSHYGTHVPYKVYKMCSNISLSDNSLFPSFSFLNSIEVRIKWHAAYQTGPARCVQNVVGARPILRSRADRDAGRGEGRSGNALRYPLLLYTWDTSKDEAHLSIRFSQQNKRGQYTDYE